MPSCALCEAPVTGRVCLVCGTRAGPVGAVRAGAGQARLAIEAAKRAVAAAEAEGVDVSVPRRLVELAERSVAEASLGKGVDAAQAARRAVDVAKVHRRLGSEIDSAAARIRTASQSGIDTARFERALVRARETHAAYDHPSTLRWLEGASIKTLDAHRQRQVQVLLDGTGKVLEGARQQGADTGRAQAHLARARNAAKVAAVSDVQRFVREAREAAADALKRARAGAILLPLAGELSAAKALGADTSDARKELANAREALNRGIYGDVPQFAGLARAALRGATRHALSERQIRDVEREVRRAERRGADVARALVSLGEARSSHEQREYTKVRSHAREAHGAVREAAQVHRIQESLKSLDFDREDLGKIGAPTGDFEARVEAARQALESGDVAAARRHIAAARHAAERARESHYRDTVRATIELIIRRAGGGGVDPGRARAVLKEVEDAISEGRAVDIRSVVDRALGAEDARGRREAAERIAALQVALRDVRRAGIDTSDLEAQGVAAKAALDAGQPDEAVRLANEAHAGADAARTSLVGSADDAITRAMELINRGQGGSASLTEATKALENARHSLAAGRPLEAIEFGRIAAMLAERAAERATEERARAEDVTRRGAEAHARGVRDRIESLAHELDAVAGDYVDASEARRSLDAATEALSANRLDEAERLALTSRDQIRSLQESLGREAAKALDGTRKLLQSAGSDGLEMGREKSQLAEAVRALSQGRPERTLQIVRTIASAVDQARRKQASEVETRRAEQNRRIEDRLARVRKLVQDLKDADIEIDGADVAMTQTTSGMDDGSFDDAEAVLADLEETAKALQGELRSASRQLIDRARSTVAKARNLKVDVEEAGSILSNAEAYFDRDEYDDAVEYARVAEQKADSAVRARQEELASKEREGRDRARAEIQRVRKLLDELAKADIEIVGSKEHLTRAEEALEAQRYADVAPVLVSLREMAESIGDGLRRAAEDLVSMVDGEIASYRARGITVPRAESVLLNARDAMRDGRFVEAIEYKKVIQDILADAERQSRLRSLEAGFRELESKVAGLEAVGANLDRAKELLARARQDIGAGRSESLDAYAAQVQESLKLARMQRASSRVTTMLRTVESAEAMGVDRADIERIHGEAVRAAEAGDFESVERLAEEAEGIVAAGQKDVERQRAKSHLATIEAMVEEAGQLGAGEEVERIVAEARQALAEERPQDVEPLVGQARAVLEARRMEEYASRYGAKVQALADTISNAERVGANVAEARRFLSDAEDALGRAEFGMVDILLKQAEISANIQVQNFVKNRYPKLSLELPSTGFQASVWNRVVFQVANKGKLGARNITVKFTGDVEVKGIEPIPELGIDEKRFIEIGMRPRLEGEVPVEVLVSYQRHFDENRYEVRDAQRIRVEKSGTYLVEDVFLIHGDGRLVAHESRKFREEIDEDIFSGMLSVVQDFIKDSFRQRSRVGLKRLDFGDSKILIERSPNTFLSAVVVGNEPPLLPIYMVEVLRQVEEKYGAVLRNWSGMLSEVGGVNDVIKRLIFVTPSRSADLGELSSSPVTTTARALAAATASGADVSEVETLLSQATSLLEGDLDSAWNLIGQARDTATAKLEEVQYRAESVLRETRIAVGELKSLGFEVGAAEGYLKEAEAAFSEGRYDKVHEAAGEIRTSLERTKYDVAASKVEAELARLVSQIREVRSQGIDVREAEAYLTRIQDAMHRKDPRHTEEYLRRARDSIDRARRDAVTSQARHELDQLIATVQEMQEVGIDVAPIEASITRAEESLRAGHVREVEALLETVRGDVHDRVRDVLAERYPRLFFTLPDSGLESGAWNRIAFSIENKGDWAARDLEIVFHGDLEVWGTTRIDRIEPKATKTVPLGLRPRAPGPLNVDTEVRYRRPLDEARYEATDSATIRVESPGSYPVEEAVVFTLDGRVVDRETRLFETGDTENPEEPLGELVRELGSGPGGLKRREIGGRTALVERGTAGCLVVLVRYEEPPLLPMYIVDVLREIEENVGARLRAWSGGAAQLSDLDRSIRKLLFVSPSPDADAGPLGGHPLGRVAMLVTHGGLRGEGGQDFYVWANSEIESRSFPEAVEFVSELKEKIASPFQELNRQLREVVAEHREAGGVEVTDDQLQKYVVIVQDVLQAVLDAKQRAGIERYWPVKRLAVKADSQMGYDALTSMRKIIVGQALAKELDIVAPDETWSGMHIQVHVEMNSVSTAYKMWARKIEILLKSQDAWKIKKGIDRGEYAVGIDGQRVRIDPAMVSFTESLPDHVIQQPFKGGSVYLDTHMTPEILAEGYAKEVVNVVRDLRTEMRLPDDVEIETTIRASDAVQKMLRSWRDLISRETGSTSLDFTRGEITGGYVAEVTLGEESFVVSVRMTAKPET